MVRVTLMLLGSLAVSAVYFALAMMIRIGIAPTASTESGGARTKDRPAGNRGRNVHVSWARNTAFDRANENSRSIFLRVCPHD